MYVCVYVWRVFFLWCVYVCGMCECGMCNVWCVCMCVGVRRACVRACVCVVCGVCPLSHMPKLVEQLKL